ncbi:MAG: DUF4349 domain-containing protein [Actinobacteria bacterium]|nr:DUF4349 domain-containing protein [Actinomycetota bacterium]
MTSPKRLRLPLLALTVLLLGAACAGNDDSSAGGDSGAAAIEESGARELADVPVADEGGGTSYGSIQSESAAALPDIGPSVIKTAKIAIEVEGDSFQASVQEAIDTAERHGGFVLSSQIGSDDERSGSIVVRVPAEQFESALSELKGLAVEGGVTSQKVSGQDVSQEFVDLRSRLRNFEAQETVLLGLMEKAATVSDSIRVQRELGNVQLEIEQLRGRLNFLEDQTQYSTITLGMSEAGAAKPEPAGAIEKAWQNAKDTFAAVVTAVIVGAGFVLPLAFLALIALAAIRFLRPLVARVR